MPAMRGEDTSYWKRDDEKYPNERKLHNFCSSIWTAESEEAGYQPDSKRLEFYARCSRLRLFLEKSPGITFVLYGVLLVIAEVTSIDGISAIVPHLESRQILWILVIAFVIVALFLTFAFLVTEDVVDSEHKGSLFRKSLGNLRPPVLYYGGLLVIVAGTVASVLLVTSGNPVEPNIVFISGFFLLLYIGGPIVYDGMKRTENLFNNLDELDIIDPNSGSSQSCGSSESDDTDTPMWNHRVYRTSVEALYKPELILPMSVIFVLPFAFLWWLGDGPFHTGSPVVLLITSILDVIIVALAIQFLLLNRILYAILTNAESETVSLSYSPYHADLKAGYRDFGRFASRVNVLLLLAVLYLAYRLYVQGRLSFLIDGTKFALSEVTPFWLTNYLLPVVVFVFVGFIWIYYSFWLIHRAMQRERMRYVAELPTDDSGNVSPAEELTRLRDAPVWPINQRFIVAVLSADLVSLSIAVSALLL